MGKRPEGYKEWNRHHRALLMYIGMIACTKVRRKDPVMCRELYYLVCRARRVQMHLDAEWEAQTKSAKEWFAERMLHILFRNGDK
jgi:hypothetical protein